MRNTEHVDTHEGKWIPEAYMPAKLVYLVTSRPRRDPVLNKETSKQINKQITGR